MNVPIQFPMVFGAVQHLQHNSFACAHARFEFNDAPPCIQLCRNLTADLLMTTANEHWKWPYALTNCACVPSRAERRSPYISDSNKQINREKKNNNNKCSSFKIEQRRETFVKRLNECWMPARRGKTCVRPQNNATQHHSMVIWHWKAMESVRFGAVIFELFTSSRRLNLSFEPNATEYKICMISIHMTLGDFLWIELKCPTKNVSLFR